jgi:hypothetical protein
MSAKENIVTMSRFSEMGNPSDVATQQRSRSAPRLADGTHFMATEPRVWLADGNRSPCIWKVRAMEIFRLGRSNMERELRTELASRILALTGREIPANLVYADPDRHMARVSVDGVSFRLTRDQVVLLSPCAYCGVREFESTAIESPADLGYALSAWKPYCRDCTPEDSNDWE